jgi:signal transduction histidine kinase
MARLITHTEARVFQGFQESVFVRDMSGVIQFWNPASEELYQWAANVAIGTNALELLQCEYPGGVDVAHAVLFARGEFQGQVSRKTASGRRQEFNVRWSLRRDESGRPIGIIETARQMALPREVEQRLKESEYRYRNLFQAMAASFWELDFTQVGAKLHKLVKSGVLDLEAHFRQHPEAIRDCLKSTLVVDLNDHSIRLFGRGDRDEMLGSAERYWPDSSIQVYARCLVKAMSGYPNNIEVTRLRNLDGHEIDCLFTACFSKENVARGMILVGIIDLTEQVETRHALETMQTELAHVARISTLGELTATIAHEIKQPLTAISTLAEAGMSWLKRPNPDLQEVEEVLKHIARNAKRSDDVIARIRSMALRRAPEEQDLMINDVIDESIQFTRHELLKHNIQVTLDLEPALLPIRADRILIQQVIVNLIMNAIQSMSTGRLVDRVLYLQSKNCPEQRIEVIVLDNGQGIAVEHLDSLFESFFTTKETGMGMGLPICRSIVEAAGGFIALTNRVDGHEGAQMTLSFPTAKSA